MSIDAWLAFAAVSALLVISPGPVAILAVNAALERGRIVWGVSSGAALGDACAMSVSASGVGLALAARPDLIAPLKATGGACLAIMGAKAIWAARRSSSGPPHRPGTHTLFTAAFLLTALHPAGLVFAVAFIPQFLDEARSLVSQVAVMQVTFAGLGAAAATGWMWLAVRAREIVRRPEQMALVRGASALVLFGFGIVSAGLALVEAAGR
jgi:threonine/homoserine/homoserine lactone efflux protein